jgi:hypothetical protein
MTPPKRRVATLFINGKPAKIIGVVPGYIVVQIGSSRPICLSLDEFEAKAEQT